MCGLSGAAGTLHVEHETCVQQLLLISMLRGLDSTGLAAIPRNSKTQSLIVKELGPPLGDSSSPGLFETKAFDRVFKGVNKCYIGHNRSGTRGKITRRNAHPFMCQHIIGAHNGTLSIRNEKDLGFGNNDKYETDSEALMNAINDRGADKVIPTLVQNGSTAGAWALTWYDERDNTVNFLRNKERPFYWIFSEDRKVIFWASEYQMLYFILDRNKVKHEAVASEATEDILFSFTVPEINEPFGEAKQTPMKGATTSFTGSSSTGYTNDGWTQNAEGVWTRVVTGNTNPYKPRDFTNGSYDYTREYDDGPADELPFDIDDKDKMKSAAQKALDDIFKDNKDKDSGCSVTNIAKARLLRLRKQNIEGTKEEEYPLFVNADGTVKITKNRKSPGWTLYRFRSMQTGFALEHRRLPPKELPYAVVNVESGGCHAFSYQRYRDKMSGKWERIIFFKGFRGAMLHKPKFESVMQTGCVCCGGIPPWGSLPRFIAPEVFVCPHCDSDETLRKNVSAAAC